ncbi:hypothetical protein KJ966_20705 [bacterium]|nr:hypothetical protein [bacterium]
MKNAQKTRADAKRRGKITMLQEDSGESSGGKGDKPESPDRAMEAYTHPFYWAPFILMGNWL